MTTRRDMCSPRTDGITEAWASPGTSRSTGDGDGVAAPSLVIPCSQLRCGTPSEACSHRNHDDRRGSPGDDAR
jgi:hypothetical protein